VLNGRMLVEYRFNLSQLNSKPAEFDLMIQPA